MVLHDLQSVAFPRLTDAQIETLARCTQASLKRYQIGQKLFEVRDRDLSFFVVKSGEVEILDESTDPPKVVTTHHPGEFTGDVSQLCGAPSIVSAVARGDCEFYEIANNSFRQILNRCPDLADVIVQAFIARRQLLRDPRNFSGVRVIGSRYSRDTLRVARIAERAIEHAVLPWCEEHDIALVAYSPFGHGRFPGPQTAGGRVLVQIAEAHDATPRQVALAFLTRRDSLFAIPKSSSPEHAAENAGAGDLYLTGEEIEQIDHAFPLGRRPRALPTL